MNSINTLASRRGFSESVFSNICFSQRAFKELWYAISVNSVAAISLAYCTTKIYLKT